jgi:hypothetical protein
MNKIKRIKILTVTEGKDGKDQYDLQEIQREEMIRSLSEDDFLKNFVKNSSVEGLICVGTFTSLLDESGFSDMDIFHALAEFLFSGIYKTEDETERLEMIETMDKISRRYQSVKAKEEQDAQKEGEDNK